MLDNARESGGKDNMNYWKQIADMLGVEMGEEFEIEGYPAPAYNPYKITENGFIDCDGDITCSEACDLLTGRCKIKKKTLAPPRWADAEGGGSEEPG